MEAMESEKVFNSDGANANDNDNNKLTTDNKSNDDGEITPMETEDSQATEINESSVEKSEKNSTKPLTDEDKQMDTQTTGGDTEENSTSLTTPISNSNSNSNSTSNLNGTQDNLVTLAAASTCNLSSTADTTSVAELPIESSTDKQQTTAIVTKSEEKQNNCSSPITKIEPRFANEEDSKWHTVGIIQGLSTTVNSYIDNSIWTSSGMQFNSENFPDLSKYPRVNLEPGVAYRFRIRAINTVGASEWSEISSFKTCLPGFPGAPSAIKISKSSEGAHLTWEPPPSCLNSNEIVEYSVYLAVKPGKEKETKSGQRIPAQLAFVRVYVGANNQCTVSHTSLVAAHVDCSNKPAIIFRIAARNEKGYGPATQVRWLQDPVQSTASTNAAAASAAVNSNNLPSPTRSIVKTEISGASPNKRFKSNNRNIMPSSTADN